MLEEIITKEIKLAMLSKNEIKLRSLRAIKAAIIIAKTAEGSAGQINQEDEVRILQKLIKQRNDSLEIYQKQNRPELAIKEKEEIAVIETFLPTQLTTEELIKEISGIITDTGTSSIADMGKIIGKANKHLAGKADGKTIAKVVKELLTNNKDK